MSRHFGPAPFATSAVAGPGPRSSLAFSSQLVESLAMPYPSPARSASPSTPPGVSASFSAAFFSSFLESHSAAAIPLQSSPDPLRLPQTGPPPPRPLARLPSQSQATFASVQIPRKRASTPPTSPFANPRTPGGSTVHRSGGSGSGRSFSLEIPTPTDAQKRSLMAKARMTESQRADEIESPMKRVKIGSPFAGTSTGRGAVRTGSKAGQSPSLFTLTLTLL